MELWVRGNCWKNKHWIFHAALLCIDMTFLNGVRNTLWRATECGGMIYFSTGSNEEQWIIVSAEGEQSSSKAWCKYCPMSTTVTPSAPPDGRGSFLNQIAHAVKWFLTKENNSVSFVPIWSIEKKRNDDKFDAIVAIICSNSSLSMSRNLFTTLNHRKHLPMSAMMIARGSRLLNTETDNWEINGGWRRRRFPGNSYLLMLSSSLRFPYE